MADRKAFVIDTIPTDPIFCKTYLGSKVKYIRHAVVVLEGLGIKIKYIAEKN